MIVVGYDIDCNGFEIGFFNVEMIQDKSYLKSVYPIVFIKSHTRDNFPSFFYFKKDPYHGNKCGGEESIVRCRSPGTWLLLNCQKNSGYFHWFGVVTILFINEAIFIFD